MAYVNADFDTAFAANAGSATFEWVELNNESEPTTQDILRMIHITSDASGAAFAGDSKGPVLLVNSYT